MNQPTNPKPQPNHPQQTGPKRLTRSREDKMIAGLCGGVARYLNIDVTLVRVLTVVLLCVGFLTPGVLYLVAWALVPQE
ncbi:MAG: PspC domain-containing protein [Marmoricola sp.]